MDGEHWHPPDQSYCSNISEQVHILSPSTEQGCFGRYVKSAVLMPSAAANNGSRFAAALTAFTNTTTG